MNFQPAARMTNYPAVLSRIFWFTVAATVVAVWWLRLHLPSVDGFLQRVDFTLDLNGNRMLPVPGGYLFPALAVGWLSRIFRLHALVSDWLGIRERFDIDVIIAELATRVHCDLSSVAEDQLLFHRHQVMRDAFYRFVSGPRPQIDPYLVEQARDAWSWFWVGVEATLLFTVTGFALVAGGQRVVGLETLGGVGIAAIMSLPTLRAQCRRYAIAQVREICADPLRADAVRTALLAVPGSHHQGRHAA